MIPYGMVKYRKYGLALPYFVLVRSRIAPMIGLNKPFKILATANIIPVAATGIRATSV
ncbi:hypothetical protein D3C85_1933380 [compost metagenome]